jgi:hypothetical protein
MLYLNIITATLLASASASTIPLTKRAEWNADGNIHLTCKPGSSYGYHTKHNANCYSSLQKQR